MKKSMPKKEAGFTFAELTFAMLILVVSSAVLINHLSVNYSTTAVERDRVFAFSKAQAILSEIQAFVDGGGVDAAVDLDVLDDGIVTKNALTIQTDNGTLVLPDHPVSGNYQRDGQWLWSRRITVQPFLGLNNRNVRYVTVRIFKRDSDGNESAMADLSAVINSAGSAYPTTQVFDVYLLAIENIPGWWVFMDSIKPFVESMITDLENRNPGMTFRTHWITKAAFGRNQAYRPFINEEVDSLEPITEVYHYPGAMPDGSASSFYYVAGQHRCAHEPRWRRHQRLRRDEQPAPVCARRLLQPRDALPGRIRAVAVPRRGDRRSRGRDRRGDRRRRSGARRAVGHVQGADAAHPVGRDEHGSGALQERAGRQPARRVDSDAGAAQLQ